MMTRDYKVRIQKVMQQRAKQAAKGGKIALLSKEELTDNATGNCYIDQYRQRLDRYCLLLYNSVYSSNKKIGNADLDRALATVLEILLPAETAKGLVKTFGSHRQLVSASFGRQLTESAKAKIRALKAQIKKIEDADKLPDEERLEKIEGLESKIQAIRDGNNYELPLYRNVNQTTFRRQFESLVVYKLNELETARTYKSLDITGSKKWVSTLEKVLTYDGVDPEKVDAFKKACDFDGLKLYKKQLEAAYKAAKLLQAEKTKGE